MSYDVTFLVDTGGADLFPVATLNHTSNCAEMFRTAFQTSFGVKELHNMQASDARDVVAAACDHMAKNSGTYAKLNPENLWGDSLSAYVFLRAILSLCEAHSKAKIIVSC